MRQKLTRNYFNKNSSTLFLKVGKLDKLGIEAGRQFQTLGPWYCEFLETLDVRATGMHAIITGCSRVISMDSAACHKLIEEKWRQQIIVVAEHEFSNIAEGIDLEDV